MVPDATSRQLGYDLWVNNKKVYVRTCATPIRTFVFHPQKYERSTYKGRARAHEDRETIRERSVPRIQRARAGFTLLFLKRPTFFAEHLFFFHEIYFHEPVGKRRQKGNGRGDGDGRIHAIRPTFSSRTRCDLDRSFSGTRAISTGPGREILFFFGTQPLPHVSATVSRVPLREHRTHALTSHDNSTDIRLPVGSLSRSLRTTLSVVTRRRCRDAQ